MSEKLINCKCSIHGMGFPGKNKKFMCEVAAERLRSSKTKSSRYRRRLGQKFIADQIESHSGVAKSGKAPDS